MSGVTAATIGGIAAAARVVIQAALPDASVYDYAPVQGFNRMPAVWFSPPDFQRHSPGEPDSQLGTRDLALTFVMHAYVLDNATGEGGRSAEDEAAELIGTIIGAIDNDPTLGGAVLYEAIVSDGQFQRADVAFTNVSGGQPVVGYEAHLEVLTLV